jgi:hypothetical protein
VGTYLPPFQKFTRRIGTLRRAPQKLIPDAASR